VEAVVMMDHVAREVEGWQWSVGAFGMLQESDAPSPLSLNSSIARAAAGLSRDLHVRAIVVLSRTGATARVVSNSRPAATVITVTTEEKTACRANLLWGMISKVVTADEMKDRVGLSRRIAREMGYIEDGQYLLMISGFSHKNHESEPALTVLRV
jgi:pyruvate kinase